MEFMKAKGIYKAKRPMGLTKTKSYYWRFTKIKDQANQIYARSKNDGCNGILDLTLEYDILDGNGTICNVTAHGTE